MILNPAPAVDSVERFDGLIDVIVPNHGEALRLIGEPASPHAAVDDGTDPLRAATLLRERTGAAVVITLGAHGALVLDDDGPATLAAHQVPHRRHGRRRRRVLRCAGRRAGRRGRLRSAAAYANAAAAVAVTRRGAEPSIPTRREVLDLLGPSVPLSVEPVA